MTEATLVIREAITEGNADHGILQKLAPETVIYCFDYGLPPVHWGKATDEELEERYLTISEKISSITHSKVAPLVTVYRLHKLAVRYNIKEIALFVDKLFPMAETIYLDLGVSVNMEKTQAVIAGLMEVNPGIKLGLIAPASEYLKFDGEFVTLFGKHENLIRCPYLKAGYSIKSQLDELTAVYPSSMEVFCGNVEAVETEGFGDFVKGLGIGKFVFWSSLVLKDLDLEKLAPEPKPSALPTVTEVVKNYVPYRSLYSSMVRSRKSLDSEMLGHIMINDVVGIHLHLPSPDGTIFGEIVYGEGRERAFVIVKHHGHEKFVPAKTE